MRKKEADFEGIEDEDIFDDQRRAVFAFVSNTDRTAKENYYIYPQIHKQA